MICNAISNVHSSFCIVIKFLIKLISPIEATRKIERSSDLTPGGDLHFSFSIGQTNR
jgi:hypothetical protein